MDKLEILIDSRKIKNRVKELAHQITNDYRNKSPIFIGVLNGSFIFFADLIREVKLETEVDFLKLSTYGDAKISSGNVKLLKDLNCTIANRDIIVVEDIIDSGISISYIRELILHHNPESLEFATLLLKKDINKLNFKVKYSGFTIKNEFVVGYGLDFAQSYRNLKSIYVLKAG